MAKRDYYEVLGVDKGASDAEIKKDLSVGNNLTSFPQSDLRELRVTLQLVPATH